MNARVILTAPSALAAIERVGALLVFASLAAEGHRAIERGDYRPDEVSRRADAQVAAWVYDVRYARPMSEDVARMVAAALDLAGIACRVEVSA